MPSRRRTRRAARPQRSPLHVKATRPKKQLNKYQKPRLVRRFMRKRLDATKIYSKHVDLPISGQDKNPLLKISVTYDPHIGIATSRKTASFYGVAAEMTAIPNPIPDSGLNATNSVGAGFPLFGAISTGTQLTTLPAPTTMKQSPVTRAPSKVSFSALPPLLSLAASSTVTTTEYTSASLPPPIVQSNPIVENQRADLKSHQITVIVIVLLSVGSGLLLLGVCVIVKICTRPRRQQRPVPSLPVLKDVEADEDFFDTGESPLFGGEARMSSTTGYNGSTWNWVQYPHTAISQPPSAQNPRKNTDPCCEGSEDSHYATQQPLPSQCLPAVEPEITDISPGRISLQDIAVATTSKRLSTASNIHYKPPKNYELSTSHERQDTVFTADGHDIMRRSKSKTANRRSRQLEARGCRDSINSLVGLAYDSADIVSPSAVEYIQTQDTPVVNNFEGRERVRSGYFAAGTYPRISTLPSATYSIATATRINVAQRNSFSKDKFSLQKSNSKRMRDTQALTYALGLASPKTDYGYGVPSPQPTLYPDDSVSIFDAKRSKKRDIVADKRVVEPVPDIPVIVPTQMAGSKSNGSLMAMNFGLSQMSLSGLALDPTPDLADATKMDRPPRVPSPPPIPSLTQMGLAHSNPEAYANYRSPTYSLYGLYEVGPDRKSVVR